MYSDPVPPLGGPSLSSVLTRFFVDASRPLHWGSWTLNTFDKRRQIRRVAQWTLLSFHVAVYLYTLPGAIERSDAAFFVSMGTIESLTTAYYLARIGAVEGNREICNVTIVSA